MQSFSPQPQWPYDYDQSWSYQDQESAFKGKGKGGGKRRGRKGRWRVRRSKKKGGKGSANLVDTWIGEVEDWADPYDDGKGWAVAAPGIDAETGYPTAECGNGVQYEFVWMENPSDTDSSVTSYTDVPQQPQPQIPYNPYVWNVGNIVLGLYTRERLVRRKRMLS